MRTLHCALQHRLRRLGYRHVVPFIAEESGVFVPLTVLLLVALLAFTVLVLDVGVVYGARRNLQNAADAAALAGARELQRSILGVALTDPEGKAEEFAAANGVPTAYGDCVDQDGTLVYNGPGSLPHSWEVVTTRLEPLLYGWVIGVPRQCVRARAVAVVVAVQPSIIYPFGLTTTPSPGITVIKQGAPGSDSGNFGIVDFNGGGGGGAEYERWLFCGYGASYCAYYQEELGQTFVPDPSEVVVGDNGGSVPPDVWTIETETGNKAAENKKFDAWVAKKLPESTACLLERSYADLTCPLVGLLPVLDTSTWEDKDGDGVPEWPSGTADIVVKEFAVFRIFDVLLGPACGSVGGGSAVGQMCIVGEFLDMAAGIGPTAPPDPNGSLNSSVIGVRLWE